MRNTTIKAILRSGVSIVAFNNTGWKMEADGKTLALKDGNPIYVDTNGNEQTVETGTIARLNGEAKTNRERAERAEATAKAFEGLDAAAARKALETVAKIDQKKLIDAGEVDKVRDEISKGYGQQITDLKTANGELQSSYDDLFKSSAFKGSKFIAERIAVPADMFEAQFGRNFKVEDGKLIAYHSNGNKVYSQKRHGELADVDEAFEILVNEYPNKDAILAKTTGNGTGSNGNGGGRPGSRTVTRAQYDAMSQEDKYATATAARKGEINLID